MNSPKNKRSPTSLKREPLPDPDLTAYNNNMESAQYQVVGHFSEEQGYRSSAEEIVKIEPKRPKEKSKSSTCGLGYALTFAFSIAASIGATAFLTYTFLKVHYDDCLTVDDLSKLRQTQILRQPRDCREHYEYGALVNGIYRVYPEKITPVQVFCDMKNGGWTVIQRRVNGDVDFDNLWNDYVQGFGNLSSDHWMGLKYQNLFTDHENQYQISFELKLRNSNTTLTAVYESFYVGNADTNFTLKVTARAKYNKPMLKYLDARNFFHFQNDMQFTTSDADHDTRIGDNCADFTRCGGYWYKNCFTFCLNGKFNSMYLFESANMPVYIETSVIKIRPFT